VARVVVIVDDADSVASSLALAFESIPGVKPVIARNSQEALSLFTAPDSKIAAVVTDLHLPYLNGFELIREIRSLAHYRNLPAIMITADEGAATNAAINRYSPNVIFRKPCSLKEVSRVLEELLA
jgi:DNA-binding response OmpR family regulator